MQSMEDFAAFDDLPENTSTINEVPESPPNAQYYVDEEEVDFQ